ncbi:Steroid 5-alpha reductase C-terminal domain-containing protein [Zobellia nedashkovskayae]
MTLSEVYFYMIIIIYQLFSLVIITFTEDLKEDKYYKRYLKITFLIGFLGIVMELLNWNYFCRFNCTLLTFSPFLTLLISKGVIEFYKKVFKREAFQMYYGKLSDGIWIKNNGDLKHKGYYSLYTVNIASFPIFIITAIFLLIEKNVC